MALSILKDVCLLAGISAIVYGLYLIFLPAAFIGAGIFLLAAGVIR